jgi:hypothetical protein
MPLKGSSASETTTVKAANMLLVKLRIEPETIVPERRMCLAYLIIDHLRAGNEHERREYARIVGPRDRDINSKQGIYHNLRAF